MSEIYLKLEEMIQSDKFDRAYLGISELATGCYGNVKIDGKLFPTNSKRIPLTDENVNLILDEPFNKDSPDPHGFRNFDDMLVHTASVFDLIYLNVMSGAVCRAEVEKLLLRSDCYIYMKYVWPLYQKRGKHPDDPEQRKFWETFTNSSKQ